MWARVFVLGFIALWLSYIVIGWHPSDDAFVISSAVWAAGLLNFLK